MEANDNYSIRRNCTQFVVGRLENTCADDVKMVSGLTKIDDEQSNVGMRMGPDAIEQQIDLKLASLRLEEEWHAPSLPTPLKMRITRRLIVNERIVTRRSMHHTSPLIVRGQVAFVNETRILSNYRVASEARSERTA